MRRIEANDPEAISAMGKMLYHEGDYTVHLNIIQRQLSWVTLAQILLWQSCIGTSMVLIGIRKGNITITKRLQLVGIPWLGTISDAMRGKMVGMRELLDIYHRCQPRI